MVFELASWPTPQASDWKNKSCSVDSALSNYKKDYYPTRGPYPADDNPVPLRLTADGELREDPRDGAYVNPEHTRWLMGLPPEWDECAMEAIKELSEKTNEAETVHEGGA